MYRLIRLLKKDHLFSSYYLLKDDLIFETYTYTNTVHKILFLKQIKVIPINIYLDSTEVPTYYSPSERISYYLNNPNYSTCIDDDTYNLIKDYFDVTGLWYYK